MSRCCHEGKNTEWLTAGDDIKDPAKMRREKEDNSGLLLAEYTMVHYLGSYEKYFSMD